MTRQFAPMTSRQEAALLSMDSPKAIKADKYGWVNGIHYLAPANLAGEGDVCSHRSIECTKFCLGEESGQAAMHKPGELSSVQKSRREKTRRFMRDRKNYLGSLVRSITKARSRAAKLGKPLCVRLNGSSDIAWEAIRVGEKALQSIIDMFPDIQFVDYTKNPLRLKRKLPANYHLTFSRSEVNEADCLEALRLGFNVAVIFAGQKPGTYLGRPVIDGDAHDLRHLDPRDPQGVIVGLTPKGLKMKRSDTPFKVAA